MEVIPLERTFEGLYGLDITEHTEDVVRAQVTVREQLKQTLGLVHGGVYASIAESLASIATALAVYESGATASGLSNSTNFLRPITEGRIHAEARPRHRGRTTWIWDVECSDDAGRLCAVTRMTIAVRPVRQADPGASSSGE